MGILLLAVDYCADCLVKQEGDLKRAVELTSLVFARLPRHGELHRPICLCQTLPVGVALVQDSHTGLGNVARGHVGLSVGELGETRSCIRVCVEFELTRCE